MTDGAFRRSCIGWPLWLGPMVALADFVLVQQVNPTNMSSISNHLVGLVVKVSASRAEDPGLESCLRWDFSGSSHTNVLKIGTPVATLRGDWSARCQYTVTG